MGIIRILQVAGMSASQIRAWIQFRLSNIPDDRLLQIKADGNIFEEMLFILRKFK
jgi:hypothetical protein